MSVATFISRILGLIRDVFFAFYFGTSWTYDIYLISFMIPQFLRRMVAEGALSSSAIPIMVEYKKTTEEKNFLDSLFTYSTILFICIVAFGILFPKVMLSIFATGILGDPKKMRLAILLVRIMFPFIGFISLASLVMGLLNTYNIFFPGAFAPALLNITIITSILLASFFNHMSIIIPAIAVSIGGIVQLIYQLLFVRKTGYNFSVNFKFHPGIKKVLNLFWPIFISYGITQINSVVDLNIASWLPNGAISSLQYAMRLFQLPIGVFAVAFSTAMLPRFSSSYINKKEKELNNSLNTTISQMAFFIIPIVFLYITSSTDIITIIFGHGRFNKASISITSRVLLAYSPGIIGYSFSYLFTRFFTGIRDTKTPMRVNIMAAAINISLDIILVFSMHQMGLALATSISGVFSAVILYAKAKKIIHKFRGKEIGKIILSSLILLISFFIKTNNPYMNIFIIDLSLISIYLIITYALRVNYLSSLILKKD